MSKIHYAQCWEDPWILQEALKISPQDHVLSIASGGDNSFALLLKNPKSIIALDKNPAQIYLVELKMNAIHHLDYDDFIAFIGARSSKKRDKFYSYLRTDLSEQARDYWDAHRYMISKGIINCGKFENYFKLFRRIVLPLIHQSTTVTKLLNSTSLQQQRTFYNKVWNNHRWRWLFRLFFGKFILGHIGRDPSFFHYVQVEHIAAELLRRTVYGLTEVPVKNNYFIEYIFKGNFSDLKNAHPYMMEHNFAFLKKHLDQMHLVIADLEVYLKDLPPGSISKFNLSDIFEYMPNSVYQRILREITRVSCAEGELAFWTLFVPRDIPQNLSYILHSNNSMSQELFMVNRTFFYGNFCSWNIQKN